MLYNYFENTIICWHLFVLDINECSEGVYDCTDLEYCEDTLGSYKCICEEGYKRNGSICEGK